MPSVTNESLICPFRCKNRHVLNKETGQWEKCRCLLIEERNVLLAQLGIPQIYWDVRLAELEAHTVDLKRLKMSLLAYVEQFKSGQSVKHLFMRGRSAALRKVNYLLLKALIPYQRATFVTIEDLTTQFLTHDKAAFNAARSARLLILQFGDEYTQDIHRHLIKNLFEHREGEQFSTVWGTTIASWQGMTSVYNYAPTSLPNAPTLTIPDELVV